MLGHLGVLSPDSSRRAAAAENSLSNCPAMRLCLATADGVFEPFHALGAEVSAGQPAGRIHTWDPGRAPETLHYAADGIVYGRRQPGRVVVGNCCLIVAAPYEGELA